MEQRPAVVAEEKVRFSCERQPGNQLDLGLFRS